MSKTKSVQEIIQQRYMISTRGASDIGLYRVSYVPLWLPQARTSGRARKVPEHVANVHVSDESVIWDNQPAELEVSMEEFNNDALRRAIAIHAWLKMLMSLIGSVEGWAKEFGWSPKRIEKPMEDSEIGKYTSPALLMQEETTKVFLEPITRSAPGAEGVVDLYLMPGYDDIASFYYYNHRWNLHYMSWEQKALANIREAESKPLTKANLKKVLEEMKTNAQ